LGFSVSVDDQTEEGPVRRAVVNRGVLTVEFFHFRRTSYSLRNKAKRAQTLYLEHPRAGWQLEETLEPEETTDNFWRFKRELGPGTSEDFTVTETTGGERTYYLSSTGLDEVEGFLSSGFIDERVAQGAREVVALRDAVANLTEEEKQLTQERAQLFKDQERIRANIESLKSGASQRELAERFVTKLNEQEDRLETIGRELERVAREKRKAQEAVNRKVQSLTFTVELGTPPADKGRGRAKGKS
jgi:hypothetical protein